MIRVYYDGQCGYCSREINYYRKISEKELFDWIDVATNPHAMADYNISQAEALLFLHAVDGEGKVVVGAEAFALIWNHLPRWKLLGKFISLPIIRTIAKVFYIWFAKRRFNSYPHCKLAWKTIPKNKVGKRMENS